MSAAPADALAAEADALDREHQAATPGADVPPPAAPEQSPNFGALAFLLAGFREVSCAVLDVASPRRTLNDANVERCARVLAPVADKYGLQLGAYLSGPEALAAMVAGPILWGAWRELETELKAKRKRAGDPASEPAGGSSADELPPPAAGGG